MPNGSEKCAQRNLFLPEIANIGGKSVIFDGPVRRFRSRRPMRLVTGGSFRIRRLLDASEARLCSVIERIEVGEGQIAVVG